MIAPGNADRSGAFRRSPLRAALVLAAALAAGAPLGAAGMAIQDEPPPTPTPTPTPIPTAVPTPETAPQPIPPPDSPQSPPLLEERDSTLLPRFNFYLPEGQADIRLIKPVRNSLFEMQVAYNFVAGDIFAFLRYKYYARSLTSTFSFFDTIEYSDISRFSNDFTRTRGALYLARLPLDFYNRLYGLLEFDRLTFSNPIFAPDANKTNLYVKAAYQYGTPYDERSNAIVGEARDRVFNLFTALRDIGPSGRGLSFAATYGTDELSGDFNYLKTELETIQAISLGPDRLVLRLHLGYFPYKKRIREEFDPVLSTPFSIPRYELFGLDSRTALKGYRGTERGPEEVHLTAEYAIPVFRNAHRRFLGLDWNDLYLVGYAGTGNVGDSGVYTEFSDYKVDAGAGFEGAIQLKEIKAFVSSLVAYTFVNGTGGPRFLLSLRTYR